MIKEKVKPIFFICLANMLMLFTFFSVNTTCSFYVHQDKVPESAKKLRKF
ncbi:cyclic lactone autoinducer peptide [uncultured Tyzzerella sp.]|nr:cyclic lactone autoinducer peptide [uncultured Tyzzerella sp.]